MRLFIWFIVLFFLNQNLYSSAGLADTPILIVLIFIFIFLAFFPTVVFTCFYIIKSLKKENVVKVDVIVKFMVQNIIFVVIGLVALLIVYLSFYNPFALPNKATTKIDHDIIYHWKLGRIPSEPTGEVYYLLVESGMSKMESRNIKDDG